MKTKIPIPKSALALLIAGLLLVSLTNLITNRLALPDFFRGGLIGIGLMLEFLALVKIRRGQNACN